MKLFQVEVERVIRHDFFVEAETEDEAQEAAEELSSEVFKDFFTHPEENVYVSIPGNNPFTPLDDDSVWVGGEKGNWLTGKEYRERQAESEPKGPPQKESLFS